MEQNIVRLDRIYNGDQYSIGHLYLNDTYICDTLEDPIRKTKIKHITGIPQGSYSCTWTISPRFSNQSFYAGKKLALLNNVPGYEGVRIHVGNSAKDTDGCILLGYNKIKGQVVNSREAYRKFEKLLYGKPFIIAINNYFKGELK